MAEDHLNDHKGYLDLRVTTIAMVDDEVNELLDERGNKLYYRHDGIFVAITKQRAALYAFNKYGSEILQRCIQLYKMLLESEVDVQIPPDIDVFDFRKYIDQNHKPIMIECSGIKDEDLEKEDGKTAKEALDLLRREIPTMSRKMEFEFLQFCNFKLLKPVPPGWLKFFEVDFEGHPSQKDFEFFLTKI
ncbi:MAG: hypothetical protein KI791_04375 [Cyclobacteriaceae bacterium]|nr:hypothetical protein [Cyclobacteriaceae bacterium SS2]